MEDLWFRLQITLNGIPRFIDFDPVRLKMFVSYADRNGRKYRTECEVEFDRFRTTAIVKCDPPKPVPRL